MKRYRILDSVRGLTLLSMTAYHAMWDLVYLFGAPFAWYGTQIGYVWQQSICWTFILLSGFCWGLGKNRLKRGLIVFAGGFVVTLATLLLMPENRVVFGVLTFLGTSMLLQILLEPFCKRCPSIVGMIAAFFLFVFLKDVNQGYFGIGAWKRMEMPQWLYANFATTFLGFPSRDFFSTDYFSLFPWYFLFLTGYFLLRFMQEKDLLHKLPDIHIAPLEWIGRHSLVIYMLHQPIVYGVLYAGFLIFA